jgi:hypothetical protein
MADPVTISAGLAVGGAVVGAAGSIFGGEATKKAYDYKGAVAQANAAYAEKNAQYAFREGAIRGQQAGMQGAQEVGAIRTAQSASGLDLTRGTATDVVKSQINQVQTNENLIAYQSAKQAYAFRVQAANFKNEAQFDYLSGKAAETEGYFGAAKSLLGGGTQVAEKWPNFMSGFTQT